VDLWVQPFRLLRWSDTECQQSFPTYTLHLSPLTRTTAYLTLRQQSERRTLFQCCWLRPLRLLDKVAYTWWRIIGITK